MNENPATAQTLFIALLKNDQPAQALPYLRFAAARNGNPPSLTGLTTLVERIIDLKKQYARDTANVQLANELAAGYLEFANATAARKYVEKSLQLDPGNADARRMKVQIQSIEGDSSAQ